uniref:Alkaline phosphatase n=1 Tax=Macrostomum lignano TaxID=282301 RepID=A0A1I8F7A7_9PLAT
MMGGQACSCQLVHRTPSVTVQARRWATPGIKYQLFDGAWHAELGLKTCAGQAAHRGHLPRQREPGGVPHTAKARYRCNEFAADNNAAWVIRATSESAITHHQYGEVYDLKSPTEPLRDRETAGILYASLHMTKLRTARHSSCRRRIFRCNAS